MEKIFSFYHQKKLQILLLLLAATVINVFNATAGTRTWIGYGAGGTASQTDLTNQANWNGGTTLLTGDDYVMNLNPAASFTITQGTGITQFNSLSINYNAAATGQKIVDITFGSSFTITNAFSITANASNNNHLINVNITGGTFTCGSVSTTASGAVLLSEMNIKISAGASFICNNSWTSYNNSKTTTNIINNGTFTVNGSALVNNAGTRSSINFLVGSNPAVIKFNGDAKFDTTTGNTDYNVSAPNKIILGGTDTNSTGSVYLNGANIIFGYCMGTDSLEKGYLYFDGAAPQTVTSYAFDKTPDRIPGTLQIGKLNNAYVDYELGNGIISALTVNNALIVNNNSTLILKAIVVPSDGTTKNTDGLIQLKPYSTLKLGTKKGKSSTLPQNYKTYSFDPTSTIEFNGNDQTVYSGSDYGNIIITDGPDASINGGIKTCGGAINILGSLKINSNAEFAASDSIPQGFKIKIKGNWTNNGTFYAKSDTVIFNGSSTQTIGGNNASNFATIIDSNTSPVALAVNETINTKLLVTTGTFSLNNYTLTLNGTYAGSGTITGSLTSGLILNANAGTLNFTSSATNNYLQQLTLNSSATATLGNALNIAAGNSSTGYGTVTVNSGATLNTNGKLTLKSNLYGTARVAASLGNINDSVVVERFIPQGRKWRFLSVPVVTNQTIKAAWQEGVTNPDVYTQVNPNLGFGTDITYDGSAGFDPNITTNTSLKTWDYTTKAWTVTAPLTSQAINNFPAYCIFVRGSRAVNLSQGIYAIQDSTVLRTKGILKQHGLSQSFSVAASGDFVFVGNPYPSSVDLTNILNNAGGIDKNKFWVWDPGFGGTYGSGGYVSYSNGVMSPVTTNYPAPTKVIQSGQAFFVQSTALTGSLSFQETNKIDSEKNVFAKQAAPLYPVISTNVITPYNNSYALVDGVAGVYAKKFSADVDGDDVAKLWNFEENIALVRNTSTLAIEFRPDIILTDTLFYRLYLHKNQPYALKIFTQNIASIKNMKAWLVDKYTDTSVEVNMNDTTIYNFTPNNDTISYRNRFMIVFNRQLTTSAVAVTKIDNQSRPNVSGVSNTITTSAKNIAVYPNPVSRNIQPRLKFNNIPAGIYEATLIDANGNKLFLKLINHPGNNASYPISLKENIPTGVYTINLSGNNNYTESAQLVVTE